MADPTDDAGAASPVRRDPVATRARLAQAALELFDRHGFDQVTTTDIAAAAGVSARTFFRHFPTKADALLHDVARRTDEFVLSLHRQPAELDLGQAVIGAVVASEAAAHGPADRIRARVLRETPSLVGVLPRYEADLQRAFADWVAQRSRRPSNDLEVEVVAAAMVAVRRVVVDRWQLRGDDGPALAMEELARRALSAVGLRFPVTPPPAPPRPGSRRSHRGPR